jgi:hypothetical protein
MVFGLVAMTLPAFLGVGAASAKEVAGKRDAAKRHPERR